MNGAANMSGRNKGCAVLLQEKAPLAVYNYYANYDLNLVLSKCSKVPEIDVMLDSLKQLRIFSNFHQIDVADLRIVLSNIMQPSRKIKRFKKRFKMFCETR